MKKIVKLLVILTTFVVMVVAIYSSKVELNSIKVENKKALAIDAIELDCSFHLFFFCLVLDNNGDGQTLSRARNI